MKLNKFLLSLVVVSAMSFAGCSDYEDTEVASPQVDENAIGANFKSATTTITVHPDKNKFTLSLNRVNTKGATSVPVTVKSCSKVDGVNFCEQPTAFLFAAGESKATVELTLSDKCKYQEEYKLALSIGDAKDHPYAAGTSSTVVSVTKDYAWTTLGQPVVIEAGWQDMGVLSPVQVASDYKDVNEANELFRIKAFYYYGGVSSLPTGHLQFYLDKESYSQVSMFTSADGIYDPQKINTGVLVDEEAEDKSYYMKVTNAAQTDKNIYTFTYDLFYKEGDVTNIPKQNVTLTLDFDIMSAME